MTLDSRSLAEILWRCATPSSFSLHMLRQMCSWLQQVWILFVCLFRTTAVISLRIVEGSWGIFSDHCREVVEHSYCCILNICSIRGGRDSDSRCSESVHWSLRPGSASHPDLLVPSLLSSVSGTIMSSEKDQLDECSPGCRRRNMDAG